VLGVGDELLHDRVEASLAGALPGRRQLVERLRDHHLLAEGAGEVLALDRLEQEGRAQVELLQRLERVGLDGARGREPGALGLEWQRRLVPQAARNLRVGRHRQLVQLAYLVPVTQDELDVVVTLRQQHRLDLALRRRSQGFQHGFVALRTVNLVEIARARPELVRVHRDPGHRHAAAPEAAREREPGPEQAEHDCAPLSRQARPRRPGSSGR
jgi:hypothetical protein